MREKKEGRDRLWRTHWDESNKDKKKKQREGEEVPPVFLRKGKVGEERGRRKRF